MWRNKNNPAQEKNQIADNIRNTFNSVHDQAAPAIALAAAASIDVAKLENEAKTR